MSDLSEIKLTEISVAPNYRELMRLVHSQHAEVFKTIHILNSIAEFALAELPKEKLQVLWHEVLAEPFVDLGRQVFAAEQAEQALEDLEEADEPDEASLDAPEV